MNLNRESSLGELGPVRPRQRRCRMTRPGRSLRTEGLPGAAGRADRLPGGMAGYPGTERELPGGSSWLHSELLPGREEPRIRALAGPAGPPCGAGGSDPVSYVGPRSYAYAP
jgi:hypothetical protein